jgi:hypothetical protein
MIGELMAYRAAARVDPTLPYPDPRNHSEEIANARAAVDHDPVERVEALAQNCCDELAELNARLQQIETALSLPVTRATA